MEIWKQAKIKNKQTNKKTLKHNRKLNEGFSEEMSELKFIIQKISVRPNC